MTLNIDYETDLVFEYRRELDSCASVQDLKALIEKYKEISPDLKEVVIESDADYKDFIEGLLLERSGKHAGENWYLKYSNLVAPVYMFRASLLAATYGVPWGVAYLQMCSGGGVPGVDPELAKQEIFSPCSKMALYKNADGTYTISSQQVWLPGVYENEKTAKYAFRFTDSILTKLMDEANNRSGGTGGTITYEDLQQAKSRMINEFTLSTME